LLKNRIGYPVAGIRAAGQLRLEKTGEDEIGIYHRSVLPLTNGLEAYGLYIVPKKPAAKKAPLVISQHGGGGFPEMALYRGGANYKDQIRGAVQEGYLVYAPHVVMYPFGDRDRGTAIPAEVRKDLDAKLRASGTSLVGVELMKLRLALDALLQRPEVDAKRVAMIGLSYGGFYATYAAAVDDRIRVVVASCSFRDDPAVADGKTEGRLLDLAPGEVAALVAPRPLQIQSGIQDKLIPIEQSRAGAKRAKEYYERQGAAEKMLFIEFEGGHEFRGSLVWPFLKKWL
jgi:dienelactone hydrolase